MSTGVQAAGVPPFGVHRSGERQRERAGPVARAPWSLAAFGALSLYGALRWGTLLSHAPVWRLLGMVGLALGVAGPVRLLAARRRGAAIVAASVATLAVLPLAGLPLAWVVHVRIAVGAHWIGTGLSALPHVLVPYQASDGWVRVVILLGTGVLLLGAGVLVAFAPSPLSQRRCAGAALPLLVLAVVPSTLISPPLPYLHGLILFALLVALIWGERLSGYGAPQAIALAAAAGTAAMLTAPAFHSPRPWLDFQALTGRLSAGQWDRFDFAQRYGPLHWPRIGREVFDVHARVPDYWKAQNLDLFDGRGFVPAVAPAAPLPPADPQARVRFTQTITVTIRGMQTSDVIAAGAAAKPLGLRIAAAPGLTAGTWTGASELAPGDSYRVTTYSPQPDAAALAGAAGGNRGRALAPYRSILLPVDSPGSRPIAVGFAPFHAGVTHGLEHSPYARAYALASRLQAAAATPYAFVQSVLAHLRRGYRYDENPRPARFPLESFLFDTKRGYCQHFSGAMALLLRMGGLPARVAGGFTTGTYDNAAHQWVISDLDAHDWVEVWFPHFGWVRFDPTPTSAPARARLAPLPAPRSSPGATSYPLPRRHRDLPSASGRPRTATTAGGGGSPSGVPATALLALAAVLGLAGVAWTLVLLLRRPRDPDGLVEELERALRRCGRPAAPSLTLAALEGRVGSRPQAAAYVRALRLSRFGIVAVTPTGAQRRALRAQLRQGLGLSGRARALWALPPRRM